MTKLITPEVVQAIHHNLVDFGYKLTIDYVQAQVTKIIAGDTDLSIIGRFAKDMLTKEGYLGDSANG